MAPFLIGKDALDHAVLIDTLFHKLRQARSGRRRDRRARGPRHRAAGTSRASSSASRSTSCSAAPGAPSLTFYASIGGNAWRTVDEVVKVVERRVAKEKPAAVKIRWDGDRTQAGRRHPRRHRQGEGGPQARRRRLHPRASTRTTATRSAARCASAARSRTSATPGSRSRCSTTTSRAMGEVAQRLDITVSAGEQTYTLQGLKDLINAGVRMVQPDIVKMGGITGLMQCAALAHAHGVRARAAPDAAVDRPPCEPARAVDDHAPDQARRARRQLGARERRCSRTRPSRRTARFDVPTAPGLGMEFDEAEMKRRSIPVGALTAPAAEQGGMRP